MKVKVVFDVLGPKILLKAENKEEEGTLKILRQKLKRDMGHLLDDAELVIYI